MTDETSTPPSPTRRRPRRGAPRVWRWIGTGAFLGFLVLGGVSLFTSNTGGASGTTYTASTAVGLMGVLGAFLGALVAGVVLALIMGREER
ncbi:hypothetical protein JNO54_03535 [Janibacter sp. YIM B02568]|uniref:hypothetical protein n=1 Tax=Janibacter endophyticus TaxID=2806261 RepID=UPI00194E5C6B|nr:hypothetical protein [Janibacter endophyticus]MBM6545215.1 hypothetical protein [Janibacter endophyticus]